MQNKNGSGDAILDWAVIGMAIILFFRTADILSYFAPSILTDIFGFDVSLIYGSVCALAVEGVALALHFNRRARFYSPAIVVKWILLAVSGICQVFDGFVITNTLSQQTDTMKAVFSYGVPLVPLFVLIMIFQIGRLPELDGQPVERKPFVGLKAMWNNLINGETNFTEGKE
jgi:hypothetical protein